jgi:hypothetical protein
MNRDLFWLDTRSAFDPGRHLRPPFPLANFADAGIERFRAMMDNGKDRRIK